MKVVVDCCIYSNAEGIWTHDHDFMNQNKIKIFTNVDLLNMI